MEVGFTGSRRGMAPLARGKVQALLMLYFVHTISCTLHHGDCVGSDEEVEKLASDLGYYTMAYPASDVAERWLAKTASHLTRDPMPALQRNEFIVAESDVLIATVQGFTPNAEQLRSGTWATIRYAKKEDCPIWLVNPMGEAQFIPTEAHRKLLGITSVNWSM